MESGNHQDSRVHFKECFVKIEKLNINIDDYDSDSSVDLPDLSFLVSSSKSEKSKSKKSKSKKSAEQLLAEHLSLAKDIQVDIISNNAMEEKMRELETAQSPDVEDDEPLSPAPLLYEEKKCNFFCVNDSLQFFNTRDATPLLCGYENRIEVTVFEKEMLSFQRVELENVISSFLFSSNTYCISDCKSFVTYLLRNMSTCSDTASVYSCYNVLNLLLSKHKEAKSINFNSAEIFMLLFNYGTDINSFQFLQQWPNVKEGLQVPQYQSKSYSRIPEKWTFNLKMILKSLIKLMSACNFKDQDLSQITIFLLWMSLDSVLLHEHFYSTLRESISACLEHITKDKWKETLFNIAKILLHMEFSDVIEKWNNIYHMTESVPIYSQRGIELRRHISFLALKFICVGSIEAEIENSDFKFSLKELEHLLPNLVEVNNPLLTYGVKFVDISLRHLNAKKEDYQQLCDILKQTESALHNTADDAKAHFLKIVTKLKVLIGKTSLYKVPQSLYRKIKEEVDEDSPTSVPMIFAKIKSEPFNELDCETDCIQNRFDNTVSEETNSKFVGLDVVSVLSEESSSYVSSEENSSSGSEVPSNYLVIKKEQDYDSNALIAQFPERGCTSQIDKIVNQVTAVSPVNAETSSVVNEPTISRLTDQRNSPLLSVSPDYLIVSDSKCVISSDFSVEDESLPATRVLDDGEKSFESSQILDLKCGSTDDSDHIGNEVLKIKQEIVDQEIPNIACEYVDDSDQNIDSQQDNVYTSQALHDGLEPKVMAVHETVGIAVSNATNASTDLPKQDVYNEVPKIKQEIVDPDLPDFTCNPVHDSNDNITSEQDVVYATDKLDDNSGPKLIAVHQNVDMAIVNKTDTCFDLPKQDLYEEVSKIKQEIVDPDIIDLACDPVSDSDQNSNSQQDNFIESPVLDNKLGPKVIAVYENIDITLMNRIGAISDLTKEDVCDKEPRTQLGICNEGLEIKQNGDNEAKVASDKKQNFPKDNDKLTFASENKAVQKLPMNKKEFTHAKDVSTQPVSTEILIDDKIFMATEIGDNIENVLDSDEMTFKEDSVLKENVQAVSCISTKSSELSEFSHTQGCDKMSVADVSPSGNKVNSHCEDALNYVLDNIQGDRTVSKVEELITSLENEKVLNIVHLPVSYNSNVQKDKVHVEEENIKLKIQSMGVGSELCSHNKDLTIIKCTNCIECTEHNVDKLIEDSNLCTEDCIIEEKDTFNEENALLQNADNLKLSEKLCIENDLITSVKADVKDMTTVKLKRKVLIGHECKPLKKKPKTENSLLQADLNKFEKNNPGDSVIVSKSGVLEASSSKCQQNSNFPSIIDDYSSSLHNISGGSDSEILENDFNEKENQEKAVTITHSENQKDLDESVCHNKIKDLTNSNLYTDVPVSKENLNNSFQVTNIKMEVLPDLPETNIKLGKRKCLDSDGLSIKKHISQKQILTDNSRRKHGIHIVKKPFNHQKRHSGPMKGSPKKSPNKFFDYVQRKEKYISFKKGRNTSLLTKTGLNLSNILKEKASSPTPQPSLSSAPSSSSCNETDSKICILSDDSDSDVVELYTDPKRYADTECLIVFESEDVIVLSD